MYDFPSSPSENQEYTSGGMTFVYKAPTWMLKVAPTATGMTISDTPPSSPTPGQLWWESDSGNTYIYYQDANTSQWIQQNTGPTGPPGPVGPQGATGSQGIQGPTGGREVLTGPRTYYVDPTKSDSNSGLSGALAFATLQKAWNVVEKLDCGTSSVTIQMVAGSTFAAGINAYSYPHGGSQQAASLVKVTGDATVTVNAGFTFYSPAWVEFSGGFKVNAPGSGTAFMAWGGAMLDVTGIVITNLNSFVTPFSAQYHPSYISVRSLTLDATASGNAFYYGLKAEYGGFIKHSGQITLLGTPGTISGWCYAFYGSKIDMTQGTYSGTLTGAGAKYNLQHGSCVMGNSTQNETTLPGNTAGAVDTSSFYLKINSARERLNATRTYYVRTDGSDSNAGTANTAGGAFLSVTKALLEVSKLDLNNFGVQIYIADGNYAGQSIYTPGTSSGVGGGEPLGGRLVRGAIAPSSGLYGGAVRIIGNITTPANVIFDTFSVNWFNTPISFEGISFVKTNTNHTISGPVDLYFNNTRWTLYNYMLQITNGAHVCFSGSVVLTNSSINTGVLNITGRGTLVENYPGMTWTFDVALTVGSGVFLVSDGAFLRFINTITYTYTGAVTGPKKAVQSHGHCYCVTSPPGSTAGTVDAAGFGLYQGAA